MPTSSKQSFWQLLETQAIAIPMLQRDYAQGRPGAATTEIRREFVRVLRAAFAAGGKPGQPVGLDFVYGTCAPDAQNRPTLTPLDGQQRLTTLFLLHWFLAAKAGSDDRVTLGRFSYETRVSARAFCAALVQHQSLSGWQPTTQTVADYLADQPWFQLGWHRDATVRGMLTMLNELAHQFADAPDGALEELKSAAAVTFQFLDLGKHQLSDDLYVRMNARGKPLTPFEHWKAQFDEHLTEHHVDKARAFAEKLDGDWTDFFWKNKAADGDDDPAQLVDVPFKRYLDFVTQMLWLRTLEREATAADYTDEVPFARYQEVYAAVEDGSSANLEFLMASLDALAKSPPMAVLFDSLLAVEASAGGRTRLLTGWGELPAAARVNLFWGNCQAPKNTQIGRIDQLLFFTVLTFATKTGQLRADDELLRDVLRIERNRLLTIRRGARESYELDNDKIRRSLPQLLREIEELTSAALEKQDAYVAVAAVSANPAFAHEREKAPFLRRGSPWRARLQQLEDSVHFRGALHLLNLGASPSPEMLERQLRTLEGLWLNEAVFGAQEFTSLAVRALAATGADFYLVDNGYLFCGGGTNGWNRIMARAANSDRMSAFDRFATLYEEAIGDWQARLTYIIGALVPIRKKDALATSDWAKQWAYYVVQYRGMTFQDGDFKRCLYKWWNWQHGDRQYHSCGMLSKTTMGGSNFHPFAWAVVQEWKDQVVLGQGLPVTSTLGSPKENGADEIPLYLYLVTPDADAGKQVIKLFYCHIAGDDDSRQPARYKGWRLQLPTNYALAPQVEAKFVWQYRKHAYDAKMQQRWLTRVVGDDELDDIEVALHFARALSEPGSLVTNAPQA